MKPSPDSCLSSLSTSWLSFSKSSSSIISISSPTHCKLLPLGFSHPNSFPTALNYSCCRSLVILSAQPIGRFCLHISKPFPSLKKQTKKLFDFMLLCCYSLIIFYQSLCNWLPFFTLISKYFINFIYHEWCMQLHEGLSLKFLVS